MRRKLLQLSVMLCGFACANFTFAQSTTINFTANQPAALSAYAGPAPIICPGASIMIGGNPSAMGGTSPFTFLWTPPSGLSSASISDPTASPTATTTYNLNITDARNCTDTSSVVVTVDTCISITNLPSFGKVSIFPNPNGGHFKVLAEMENEAQNGVIKIFSLNGQLIYEKKFNHPGKLIDHEIDLSKKSSGIYNIDVIVDGTKFSNKVIIR